MVPQLLQLRDDLITYLHEKESLSHSMWELFNGYDVDLEDEDIDSDDFISSVYFLGVIMGYGTRLVSKDVIGRLFREGDLMFLGIYEHYLADKCHIPAMFRILLYCKSKCGLI